MNLFQNIEFIDNYCFLFLIFIPFFAYFFYKKQKKWLNFILIDDLKKIFIKNDYKFSLKIILLIIILFSFILLFANPNYINSKKNITKNWIDIVLALDISWSMESTDLNPSRIEAAKKVINDFISNIKTDRLGLVIFAWKPFTSIPLTFDYNILHENIDRLTTKTINQQRPWLDWTAIWDAILMSKTLFKAPTWISKDDYEKRQKAIILLTDWDANVWVEPTLASLSAAKEKIKIFTIWIWSEKWWILNYNVWWFINQVQIPPLNDKTLKEIAQNTNWEFFRATDNDSFKKIFETLQKLEKNDIKISVTKLYNEYYTLFINILIISLFCFCILIFRDLDYANDKF